MTGLDFLGDEDAKQDCAAVHDERSATSACGQKLFGALDHHYAPRISSNCVRPAAGFNVSEIPATGAEVRTNDYHRRYPAHNEATRPPHSPVEPPARSAPGASDGLSPPFYTSPRDYVSPNLPSGPRSVPEAPGAPGGGPEKLPGVRGAVPRYVPGHPDLVPEVPGVQGGVRYKMPGVEGTHAPYIPGCPPAAPEAPPGGELPPTLPSPESTEDFEQPSLPSDSLKDRESVPPNSSPMEKRAQPVPTFEQELANELEGRIANATNRIVDSIDSKGQIPPELRKAFYDYLETKPIADNVEAKLFRHCASTEGGIARVNLFLALKGSAYRLVLDKDGPVKQLALVGPGSQVVDCAMLN